MADSAYDASQGPEAPPIKVDHHYFMREALNMVLQTTQATNPRDLYLIGVGRKSSSVR